MNIVIDIGNSRIKLGYFRDNQLLETAILTSIEDLLHLLNAKESMRIIVSSVTEIPDALLDLKNHYSFLVLTNDTPLPFKVDYETPDTLGLDRVAAAAGALTHYKGPLLIIDAGTCITCDYVNEHNIFCGGHISPGVQMRLDAMHTFTANLPLLKPGSPLDGPGKSTKDAMIGGAVLGARHEIEGFINYYKRKQPELKVILCGGDSKYFDKIMEFNTFALPNLVLEGLNSILTFDGEK
jgi:type III pantothenate kinase